MQFYEIELEKKLSKATYESCLCLTCWLQICFLKNALLLHVIKSGWIYRFKQYYQEVEKTSL